MNDISIYSKSIEDYSSQYHDHALEQYKLYLELTDRISSRRQSANSFFVALNTLLVSISGYAESGADIEHHFITITSLAGFFICYIWYRLIKSYKNLNTGKFKVVHLMEKELPFRLYDAEWDAVGRGENKKLYHPFTRLEMRVPWIFFSLHLIVVVYLVVRSMDLYGSVF